jgi:hypothetical protein
MFLTENERQAFINCVAAISDADWNSAFANAVPAVTSETKPADASTDSDAETKKES